MKIYVAGPMAKGDQVLNVRVAIDAGAVLLGMGHAPFIPHLTMWWHLVHPEAYETWMAFDFIWVEACDGLLRLPGESPGADREVAFARRLGKPVWFDVHEVR